MMSDDFEEQWNKFTDKQKKQYALDLIADAYLSGKITEEEAISAIENIEYFVCEHHLPITIVLINILRVVAKGDIRFLFVDGTFKMKSITSPERYIELIAALPITEQVRIKSNVVTIFRALNLITDDEANEAFADIMRESMFVNYNDKSNASAKINQMLKQAISSDFMKTLW